MNLVVATRSCYSEGPTELRKRLFEKIAAFSLSLQTRSLFTWLVRVDPKEAISSVCRKKTTDLLNKRGIQVVYTEKSFGEWVARVQNSGLKDIRMVRMDDDDALAYDFVARLSAMPWQDGRWHVFPNGHRLWRKQGVASNHPTNQFISLDVPNGSGRHVYELNHLQVKDAVVVDDRPAWLWVRHEESKSAGGRGRGRVVPLADLRKTYGFDIPTARSLG